MKLSHKNVQKGKYKTPCIQNYFIRKNLQMKKSMTWKYTCSTTYHKRKEF